MLNVGRCNVVQSHARQFRLQRSSGGRRQPTRQRHHYPVAAMRLDADATVRHRCEIRHDLYHASDFRVHETICVRAWPEPSHIVMYYH